jgi:hypothetical protein
MGCMLECPYGANGLNREYLAALHDTLPLESLPAAATK